VLELRHRVDEFVAAPVAAAFFVLADRYGLDADQLAEPDTATALASCAVRELNPWSGTAVHDRARVLGEAPRLRALVTDVLTDPRTTWWSAPLQLDAQLLLLDQRALTTTPPPDPWQVPEPGGANDEWQTYAQRPLHQVITTTELTVPVQAVVRSGAHADLYHGVSDWDADYPVHQSRLRVAAGARVLEVDSAVDWHHLVAAYGDPQTADRSESNLWTSAGIEHGPAPEWSRVAEHADAVHLTFAGLLTGLYVPVSSAGVGVTTLWAWYFESTWWMRSAFSSSQDLAPLVEPPDDHARFSSGH